MTMMTGRVTANYEAVVEITLQDAQGQIEVSKAVVDTGFNGFLTLPLPQIARLKERALTNHRMIS